MEFITELFNKLSNLKYKKADKPITVWYNDESITFESSGMDPDEISDKVDDIFKYLKTKDLKYK
jgi:hypothetical protein